MNHLKGLPHGQTNHPQPARRDACAGEAWRHHGDRHNGRERARAPGEGIAEPRAATTPQPPAAPFVTPVADGEALAAPAIGRPALLIDLALQGGGSHGAFTWGVLDRLLEERWLTIEAISGTSAGAMNAAVMADGFAAGGADGARQALESFWSRVSKAAAMSPLKRGPLDVLFDRWTLVNSPVYVAMDVMTRLFSPYDMPFGGRNPL